LIEALRSIPASTSVSLIERRAALPSDAIVGAARVAMA
jgi:hypothetical protein